MSRLVEGRLGSADHVLCCEDSDEGLSGMTMSVTMSQRRRERGRDLHIFQNYPVFMFHRLPSQKLRFRAVFQTLEASISSLELIGLLVLSIFWTMRSIVLGNTQDNR